jgi:alkanesulfonate monooxygenase SsuD/methylene tetrahydromethanopterin reductase-like flavin-dependent oxidoreductase (luciferase family)
MWTQDTASFDGNFYHLRNAHCNPKPIQKPHPPIMIGGSGERETLKLVAKYGDACNLFGSVDTVKHKLAVLRNHCKDIGRDYNSILKTKLGRVLIAKDKEDLKAKLAQATQGVPEERVREFLLFGTPEEVHRQLEDFRDAGIDYFIIGTDPQHELEYVDLFGREIAKKF